MNPSSENPGSDGHPQAGTQPRSPATHRSDDGGRSWNAHGRPWSISPNGRRGERHVVPPVRQRVGTVPGVTGGRTEFARFRHGPPPLGPGGYQLTRLADCGGERVAPLLDRLVSRARVSRPAPAPHRRRVRHPGPLLLFRQADIGFGVPNALAAQLTGALEDPVRFRLAQPDSAVSPSDTGPRPWPPAGGTSSNDSRAFDGSTKPIHRIYGREWQPHQRGQTL